MTQILQQYLAESPVLAIFIVFWAGAVASLASCTLIRMPIVLGYVAGTSDSRNRSLILTALFILGCILSYTILGAFFGFIGNVAVKLVRVSKYVFWALGGLLFLVGLFVSGLINPKFLSSHCHVENRFKASSIGAFLFGIVFALLEMPACPCCGALLLIIGTAVAAKGSILYSMIIFMVFAMGQGIPLLMVGSSASLVKYLSPKISRFEGYIRLAAGNVLLILGIYFLVVA